MAEFRKRRKKVCKLCQNEKRNYEAINYKDSKFLKFFISDKGKILPRRVTGTCARHQRTVATSIKRARHMALIPFCD